MTIELIPIILALVGVFLGSYSDLKEGKIPNELTLSMLLVGLGFHVAQGVYCGDFSTGVLGFVGAVVGFALTYPFYLFGGFGGGDVKLMAAVGGLLPTTPTLGFVQGTLLFGSVPLFPITVLVNGLLLSAPLVIGYILSCLAHGRPILVRKVCLSGLERGMLPAEGVYQRRNEIIKGSSPETYDRCYADPSDSQGLQDYQIGGLLRLYKEEKIGPSLRIKRTFPFAPAIAGGTFLAILFGNVYFALLAQVV